MSAHYPDQRDWKREVLLHNHPAYMREWDLVRSWVSYLRRAETPGDYYELHGSLLARGLACQQFQDQCRKRSEALGVELKAAKAAGAATDTLRGFSEEIEIAKRDREAASAILGIQRMLGDALVWRVLRYARPIITFLGQGRAVGRLTGGTGLQAELDEITYLWETKGIFALHADLTNCVRHGDVLSIESWDPLQVRLTESKAGGRGPTPAQAAKLERVSQLINDGFHPSAVNGAALSLQRPRIHYETHLGQLQLLVAGARRQTHASLEVEPGVVVEVYDEANPAGLSSGERKELHNRTRAEQGWEDDDQVISYSASARRLRDRHADHTFSSLAPLAILPLGLDEITDLVFGRLDFITTINAKAIEQRLATAGIAAQVARGREAAGEGFMQASRGSARITVPATVREQVQVELLQLKTVFSTIDWFLAEIEQGGEPRPNVAIAYEDERAVWEATGTGRRREPGQGL
jgi:hypothetical protein